jgi:hypothetical protein
MLMIEASFGTGREAAIDGVYQYDTGQRLRLSGLPSPEEMNLADDFLSGDLAAVQVQFGRDGDSQTESRLAEWQEERVAWMCSVPDEYMINTDPVNVYVYVTHSGDGNGTRSKTMYTGVFTPQARPAPGNTATEDQLRQWEQLEAEVDLALVAVNSAAEKAQAEIDSTNKAADATDERAEDAKDAARYADDALYRLETIESQWGNMNVRVVGLGTGSTATASLDGNMLTLGVPRGSVGPKGPEGAAGPTDIGLSFSGGVLTITPK